MFRRRFVAIAVAAGVCLARAAAAFAQGIEVRAIDMFDQPEPRGSRG